MFLFVSEIVLLVESFSLMLASSLAVSNLKTHNQIEDTSLPEGALEFAMSVAIFTLFSHAVGTKLLFDCVNWKTRERRAKFLFPYVIARAVFVFLFFICVIVCKVNENNILMHFSGVDSTSGLLLGAVVQHLTAFLAIVFIMQV